VQEILLPQCNGSAAWLHSLVIAIQQASPLPAPPSPTVFTNALTMTFTGFEYRPDSSADEYEIEVPRTQVQNNVNSTHAETPAANLQRTAVWGEDTSVHALRAPTDEPQPASNDSQ
jgi:hypothetical protein